MRTGIFVYADTVEYLLRPEISSLVKYNGPGSSTVIATKGGGTIKLTKGIYRLITDKPTELLMVGENTGESDVVVVMNDKDIWPDSPAIFVKTFPDVTAADLQAFFPASFDAFDSQAPSASSDAPHVTR
jgi:hypothetical protein